MVGQPIVLLVHLGLIVVISRVVSPVLRNLPVVGVVLIAHVDSEIIAHQQMDLALLQIFCLCQVPQKLTAMTYSKLIFCYCLKNKKKAQCPTTAPPSTTNAPIPTTPTFQLPPSPAPETWTPATNVTSAMGTSSAFAVSTSGIIWGIVVLVAVILCCCVGWATYCLTLRRRQRRQSPDRHTAVQLEDRHEPVQLEERN